MLDQIPVFFFQATHIHHALFTLTEDDHFTTSWGANKDGKSAGDSLFTFNRKK